MMPNASGAIQTIKWKTSSMGSLAITMAMGKMKAHAIKDNVQVQQTSIGLVLTIAIVAIQAVGIIVTFKM